MTPAENQVYEDHLPVILDEATKAANANVVPAKGYLDYIQDGCIAALKAIAAGRDIRLVRMDISRAMRES